MKTFILLATVCLLGVVSTAPVTNGLYEDVEDFLALLPMEKIIALHEKYEAELKKVSDFYHTEEFAHIWDQLSGSQEFREFVYYLNDAGIPVIEYLNAIAKALNLPEFPKRSALIKRSSVFSDGLKDFYDEFLELLPKEEIKALYNEKMKNSKEFAELYHKIASADFQNVLKFLRSSEEMMDVFNKLRSHGIEVDRIGDIIARIFGWKN